MVKEEYVYLLKIAYKEYEQCKDFNTSLYILNVINSLREIINDWRD
jgi:hypothetical protein